MTILGPTCSPCLQSTTVDVDVTSGFARRQHRSRYTIDLHTKQVGPSVDLVDSKR